MNAPWHPPVRPSLLLASMPPIELRYVMIELGCHSQKKMAARIGVSRSAVGSWLNGHVGVPYHIAMLLRLLCAEAA